MRAYVCVCVRACVRACVCAYLFVCYWFFLLIRRLDEAQRTAVYLHSRAIPGNVKTDSQRTRAAIGTTERLCIDAENKHRLSGPEKMASTILPGHNYPHALFPSVPR